jgi:hypothetical protein
MVKYASESSKSSPMNEEKLDDLWIDLGGEG